ncbi:MAG: polymer-forming cytoskeletal protein [Polyangiaceae bacterium]
MWPFRRAQGSNDIPSFTVDNTIGAGTTIRGDLKSPGGVRVEGTIDGALDAEGPVVVGEGGAVYGTVRGSEVVVLGTVRGDVQSKGHLEIGPKGTVDGDISVSSFRMHTGGVFCGTSHMPDAHADDAAHALPPKKVERALPAAPSPVRAADFPAKKPAKPDAPRDTLVTASTGAPKSDTAPKSKSNTLAPPSLGAVPPPPGMSDLPPLTPSAGVPVPVQSQERIATGRDTKDFTGDEPKKTATG